MSEPEREIEKLLKARAQKRRDEAGAPLEMHPATRRLLHAEIARKTSHAPRGSPLFTKMFFQIWPRFAYVLPILILGVLILFFTVTKTGQPTKLANDFQPAPTQAKRQATPRPAASPAPAAPAEASGPLGGSVLALNEPAQAQAKSKTDGAEFGGITLNLEKNREVETADRKSGDENGASRTTQFATILKEDESKKTAALGGKFEQPPLLANNDASVEARRYGLAQGATPPSTGLGVTLETTADKDGTDSIPNAPAEGLLRDRSEEKENLAKIELALKPPPAPAPSASALSGVPADDSRLQNDSFRGAETPVYFANKVAREKFRRQADLAARSSEANDILTAFQVEQAGSQLRIIDSDGSTYAGSVQALEVVNRQRLPAPQTAAPARSLRAEPTQESQKAKSTLERAAEISTEQSYSFRVEGTNRTLKQKVVFNGSFLAGTNATPVVVTDGITTAARGARKTPAVPTSIPLQRSRITGKAVIGDHEIEINAAPVAP